ncbi:MAG TPA: DUF4349 domain-containing protein [Anaerolineales bacterium]|nr:DUF4349 domain-containing protein [Anaerolineales bacterium]
MKARTFIIAAVILLAAIALAACGAAATPTIMSAPPLEGPMVYAAPTYAGAQDQSNKGGEGGGAPAVQATPAAFQTGPDTIISNTDFGDHMIVKNGDIRLLVKDSDVALDGVTQIVGDVHGYIVSSRVWFQDYYGTNYKYATLTFGVPVDQFETALRRLRGLAIRVLDENASGEDVTDQYVDLQSQLENLEATRDRIQSFLNQAKTVDEALRINQQLSDVEAQIEQIKGRMNYLSNRSAFSTLTVNIEPQLPEIVATPTLTPTPTPTPALAPWNPGDTTGDASRTLITVYRGIVDFLIWVLIVFVPIFAPPVLLVWLVVWFLRKKTTPPVSK